MSGRITSRGKPKRSIRMTIRRKSSREGRLWAYLDKHPKIAGLGFLLVGFHLSVGVFLLALEELVQFSLLIIGLVSVLYGSMLLAQGPAYGEEGG